MIMNGQNGHLLPTIVRMASVSGREGVKNVQGQAVTNVWTERKDVENATKCWMKRMHVSTHNHVGRQRKNLGNLRCGVPGQDVHKVVVLEFAFEHANVSVMESPVILVQGMNKNYLIARLKNVMRR
jgi:hypothetical protein